MSSREVIWCASSIFFCVELVASNRTPPRHHPPPGLTRSRSPGPLQKRPRGRPPLSTDNRDHATHVALDRSRVLLSTELASHQRRRAGPAAVEGSPLPHHTSHHTIHGHLGMAWPSPRGARKQPPRGRSRGPPTRPASASASTVTDGSVRFSALLPVPRRVPLNGGDRVRRRRRRRDRREMRHIGPHHKKKKIHT